MPDGTAIVSLRLTQQEIADRVGTTRGNGEPIAGALARARYNTLAVREDRRARRGTPEEVCKRLANAVAASDRRRGT